MNIVSITFVNTINNAEVSASVPQATSREQILQTLIANGFVQPPQQGQSYKVTLKGRREMTEGETHIAHTKEIGEQYRKRIRREDLHRAVCDYIAGMTDRYVMHEYQRHFGLGSLS